MAKKCSFMVIFADGSDGRFIDSYCIDLADALAQCQEIFANEISDIVLFRFL